MHGPTLSSHLGYDQTTTSRREPAILLSYAEEREKDEEVFLNFTTIDMFL